MHILISRSRKGAWIEISLFNLVVNAVLSRSRKGAWIEIYTGYAGMIALRSLP